MNEIDAQKSAAVNRNNGKQTHHGKYIKQTTKTRRKKSTEANKKQNSHRVWLANFLFAYICLSDGPECEFITLDAHGAHYSC